MNTNLPALFEKYHQLSSTHDSLVLATIIETMGSTYRKAGARMIITPEAKFFGLLGGGCFEADLLAHAEEVFSSQKNKIVFYDMRAPEDEIWGLGLGCNGAVRILLQFVPGAESDIFRQFGEALESKKKQVFLSVCESTHEKLDDSVNILVRADEKNMGNTGETWPKNIQEQIIETSRTGAALYREHDIDGEQIAIFTSEIKPPFHLMVIGAGPDAEPITRFAKELGWKVSLVDYRESFLEQACFSGVDNIILGSARELSENPAVREIDALVIMTHKIEQDELYLKGLTETSASYIGLLGPAARRDRLVDALGDGAETLRSRIFGPVGLDIGGETPEEIALSLVAEIQATHYGRNAQSLHQKNQPLHEEYGSEAANLQAVILAAGGAKRFGGLKQMLEYEGASLLRRSITAANQVVEERVKVVLGARARKITREVENLDAAIVLNEDWESGMASSIKAGLDSLSDDCDAILLILCDQALINADHLQQLQDLWLSNKSHIVAASYSGTVGAPVIIPREFFPDLMKLKGDRGAKSVIENNMQRVSVLEIPEAEFDIDTEEDYTRILSRT